MSAFVHSMASLRFFGDDLVPDEITALLGTSPTQSHLKGQELIGRRTGNKLIAKTGSWRLRAIDRAPEDLEGQIFEILDQLTQDLSVWASLSRYQPDLFCGLFMGSSNDGISLSAKALLAIGQRGISLDLDTYDAGDDDDSVES
ncbi:DUF4279 domain-containing protein [Stenotrophomonas sp.]|uniref:DUF4279 domain-containing protein n=1 Tax=Stenotrophomonas sp. TaxID=69392 RepID=UPI002899A85A|nr:DUF4279 domain-containing protein [Stenotrophomonas sp.]